MKSRMIAMALGAAVMLVTSVASAEEQCATGTTFVAIEAQAEAATEKMLLPVIALVVGMILFIGFGVVQAISTPGTVP